MFDSRSRFLGCAGAGKGGSAGEAARGTLATSPPRRIFRPQLLAHFHEYPPEHVFATTITAVTPVRIAFRVLHEHGIPGGEQLSPAWHRRNADIDGLRLRLEPGPSRSGRCTLTNSARSTTAGGRRRCGACRFRRDFKRWASALHPHHEAVRRRRESRTCGFYRHAFVGRSLTGAARVSAKARVASFSLPVRTATTLHSYATRSGPSSQSPTP